MHHRPVIRAVFAAFAVSVAVAATPTGQPTPRHTVPMLWNSHAPTSVPHLTYYGGPVVPNVLVYQVLWGTGTYLAGVADGGSTTPTKLGDFYSSITASSYIDWLCEYNTSTQSIGRGTFGQSIQITPSSSNNGSLITDSQIQAELARQISLGVLPPPGPNTAYMINFPAGKTIDDGFGDRSCQVFCAYHGTMTYNGQYLYYGVFPDFAPPSPCASGCGTDSNVFNDLTSTASHELIETITDPAVGFGPTPPAAPLAWYDAVNGEIGDICDTGIADTTTTGGDGRTWTVQKEWSNALASCIATKVDTPPVARCKNVTETVFGCTASASIDNGSSDADCWDTTLTMSQNPPPPYPVGVTSVVLTVTDKAGQSSTCSGTVTVSSTGCDDGIACTTGDTCNGSVCAGTPGPPPGEADNGVRVTRAGATATITWNMAPGATASDVVSGHISGLPVGPGGGDETCLGSNVGGTLLSDSTPVTAADALWYLVRGRSFCGEGTWGSGQPPSPRVTTTCP